MKWSKRILRKKRVVIHLPLEEEKKRKLLTPEQIKDEWDKIYLNRQRRMFPDNRKKNPEDEESRVINL